MVEVTAVRTEVFLGGTAILTCVVTRGIPKIYAYSWTHEDTVIADHTSATLTIFSFSMDEAGAYSCRAVNDAGTGVDIIVLRLAGRYYMYIRYCHQWTLCESVLWQYITPVLKRKLEPRLSIKNATIYSSHIIIVLTILDSLVDFVRKLCALKDQLS